MAKKKVRTPEEKTHDLLEKLIETVQDLFILQALEAGAGSEPLRKQLRVNKWRITNVSKLRKRRKTD
jgi:hypothetical protein